MRSTRFLSTPSARRATGHARNVRLLRVDFYPRPPRGGRPILQHWSREDMQFLSTPSARRATFGPFSGKMFSLISIHALREEGDRNTPAPQHTARLFLSTPSARRATPPEALRPWLFGYFYPRPPRGGRPFVDKEFSAVWIFLSTPSARRATTRSGKDASVYNEFLSTPSARRATFVIFQFL